MKKIEKVFYVDESNLKHIINPEKRYCEPLLWLHRHRDAHSLKITISWEEPEKKITISESEFDEAIKIICKQSVVSFDALKQKLFGDKNE